MSGIPGVERRRQPRWTLTVPVACRLEVRSRVRLVDISASGAMLATEAPAAVGAVGQLRAGIGPAFASGVQVRRLAAGGERTSPAVGVMFTGMDDRSRRSLDEFLKKANT